MKNLSCKYKAPVVLAVFLAIFCILVWGVSFVCTKYLLKDFNSLEILFYRFIIAYIWLWILYPKALIIKDIKKEFTYAMAGLTGVLVYQLLENMAINYANASSVSIIVSISPVFTAITSQLFLHTKSISRYYVLGFIIAIIGVTLVSFNGVVEFDLSPLGDILALGCCVCWGFYSLFVTKANNFGYNQIQGTRRIFMYAIIFMIPLIVFEVVSGRMGFDFYRFTDVYNILNILFLGIVASGLCFVFWNKACAQLGAVKVSLGIYLIPVVTIVFAFFALDEKISLMGAVGTVFAIAGVFISGLKKQK